MEEIIETKINKFQIRFTKEDDTIDFHKSGVCLRN